MKTYVLKVSRADFAEALAVATARLSKRDRAIVRFEFDGSFLDVFGPAASRAVHATGSWPATVQADAAMIRALSTRLPAQNPLVLSIEGNRLAVASFMIGVEVVTRDVGSRAALAEPDLFAVVAAVESRGAGVPGVPRAIATDQAIRELNSRIDRAVAILAPYGVPRGELEALVHAALRRKHGGEGE